MPARSLCAWCHMREVDDRFRPFCSDRCKMADLGRWLSGDYRVPADPGADDELSEMDDESGEPGRGPH